MFEGVASRQAPLADHRTISIGSGHIRLLPHTRAQLHAKSGDVLSDGDETGICAQNSHAEALHVTHGISGNLGDNARVMPPWANLSQFWHDLDGLSSPLSREDRQQS